ncbi:MAG TPA: methyl-accepting chemotaxis protein [Candidatus Nitrosotalea sp.]|nr:methyl-accepting chemotaxis protein [Candidatus Nitrosotalea sp.]
MSNTLVKPDNSLTTSEKNPKGNGSFTLERVAELSEILAGKVESAIGEIERLNGQTHMIAINARIEASRAGMAGKAFSVVAEQMNDLSGKIGIVSKKMRNESRDSIDELGNLIKTQATNVRGTRLSDLALTNIDLIDRNLYERSCDVRWWATDDSVVNALSKKTKDAYSLVSKRLGIILNSYTVYFDLVLCDLDGNIVANGKPEVYRSVGMNAKNTTWFVNAMKNASGKEFGFQTVSKCPMVNNELSLVFSCTVRENGDQNGQVLGVLGAVFRWQDLAQKIVKEVSISNEEKDKTRICIVDENGLLLADSRDLILEETIEFLGKNDLFGQKKGFSISEYKDEKCCIAHAFSPGYETYSSNWHSLIIQKLQV